MFLRQCRRVQWCRGTMGRALGLRSTGHGFRSMTRQSCVTILGKLLTPMCPCHQTVGLGTGQGVMMLWSWGGNRRPGRRVDGLWADCLYAGIIYRPNAR